MIFFILILNKYIKYHSHETHQELLSSHRINYCYRTTDSILSVQLSLLSKINRPQVEVYNVAIYGNRADAAMLAYFIDKKVGWQLRHVLFNITMIEPPPFLG
jgi:hypothetical protein